MSIDANGNDLDAVSVPVTGFVAVQLSGTAVYVTPEDGAKTPFVIPTGYKKIGLFTEKGAPQDDSKSDDDIELWQTGYKIRGDVKSRTLEVITAELNDTVRTLTEGVAPDANGMIVIDQGNQAQFPLIEYVKYKNGMSRRRNGLARISSVSVDQQTRGDVAGNDITFEWVRNDEIGGFYREWIIDPSVTNVKSLAIKATDGTAAPTTVKVGSTLALKAVATMADASTADVCATWASSDATNATVTGGTVTGVATGSVTITASYAGISASLSVTVSAAA